MKPPTACILALARGLGLEALGSLSQSHDDNSLIQLIQTAHDMTQKMSNTVLLGSPGHRLPMPIPDVAKPGGLLLALLQHMKTCLEELVKRMDATMDEERAGLATGGSTKQHSLEKLLTNFGSAGDHNMAMEYVADITRCICLRAQRPVEQAKENIKDVISAWDEVILQLSTSRMVCEGDTEDGLDDEEEGTEEEEE
ncbi:hypothetical protein B0T24DRAFT_678009 [Lasiosphaeria ovina]|uniref:Uncharacterized protein n=1 Tax=Lasiosphaeria ovina TaxID=92902 RepID=A0AAE0NBB8_9PEZI|nr:hypothetical protein B0T24DRAFT_678009 [Lasiosphaeria ovina]